MVKGNSREVAGEGTFSEGIDYASTTPFEISEYFFHRSRIISSSSDSSDVHRRLFFTHSDYCEA